MITPEQHAEIRRLYYGEHWKVGTIAATLGLHPSERCAVVVVGVDVREDGGAQLRNAAVRSTFERLLRQQSKEPLH